MATILVADDNEQNSGILKDVLESWGYKVVLAISGDTALDIVRTEIPDLILLDVMMPGLSGYEVCQILRQQDLGKNIPIILLTALSDVEDRIHGYNVGADVFLTKPVNYQELKALLEKLLMGRKESSFSESTERVVNFLTYFLPRDDKLNKEIREMEQEYGQKLLQELNLSAKAGRYLTIALKLQDLEKRLDSPEDKAFRKALEQLQLGSWLIPILTYRCSKKTATFQALEEQEGSPLVKVAAVFLVLKTYGRFYREHKGNSSDALTALRRAALAGECSRTVVELLSGIVKDKLLLADLV
jgi:DNA-binding response OmpR family regulator